MTLAVTVAVLSRSGRGGRGLFMKVIVCETERYHKPTSCIYIYTGELRFECSEQRRDARSVPRWRRRAVIGRRRTLAHLCTCIGD